MKTRDKAARPIRILIADDHSIVRDGLAMILDIQPDLTVVGQAKDGLEAVRAADETRPDVAIVDLMMPKLDGCQATVQIKECSPQTAVLILTSFVDSTLVTEAMRKGASGAIGKDSPREDLLSAIRAVAAGEQVLSPDISRAIKKSTDIPSLSPRQHDVLESISRGLTNDDIARQYNLSKSAVKFHLLELYRKLNVSNRAEAVAIALRKHLLKI